MDVEPTNGRGKIGIIGVPLGYGAEKTGSELGVESIRTSPIRGKHLIDHIHDLGLDVKDLGDVEIVKPTAIASEDANPNYLSEITHSSVNIALAVKRALDDGRLPIILGGDHSIAIGSFSGLASHFRARGEDVGLIWFDAHADINTPATSTSGNIHGMPLAAILGEGPEALVNLEGFSPKLRPQHFAHVGARDLDSGERQRIDDLGVRGNFFTMSDIDKRGMLECVEKAIEIASSASGGFAVTFDVDVIDPRFAPGSGTLVRGGATYREAHLALELIAEHGGMRSFEIVEVNPLLDQNNITVELAAELILSALGKTIL
jgi:arginase